MVAYGGLGGVWNGRILDTNDAFEAMVARTLDLSDETLAAEMWGSLANQPWLHENGDTADYSFRAAGDLVAAARRYQGVARDQEDYCRWYCSAAETVTPRIVEALSAEGWRPLDEAETKAWYQRDLAAADLWDAGTLATWMTEQGDKPFMPGGTFAFTEEKPR